MYLYEKQDNKVLIHNIICKKEDLIDYRKNEIKKICNDDIEYSLEEKVREYEEPVFRRLGFNNIMAHTSNNLFDESYIKMEKTTTRNDRLIYHYINGRYYSKKLAGISGDENKYYLLTDYYNFVRYETDIQRKCYKLFTMKGIIHLPETLAILQLIERGKFSLIPENINEKNIMSVLDLYKHELIDEIDLIQLEKADKYHITINEYKSADTKASIKSKNDYNIVKRLKKMR